jgi:DUF4097 and DUF4098 domain-containing protein YvlB
MFATALVAVMTMAVTHTDQTVQVQKGTRLEVRTFAGDVVVKTWDKDAVRVQAEHSDRETVDIQQGDHVVTVRSQARRGAPRSVDYTLTVPAWMPVSASGTYMDATMDGVGADVTVETTRGDIAVTGGSGVVTLKSVDGEIQLNKAKGHVEVRAVNEGVQLADVAGDVSVESVNGDLTLDRIDSANVDLYTVNGNIVYDGPIRDKGVYRMTTHNGLISVAVAESANATVTVRTYSGSFKSSFPVKVDEQNTRKRFTLTFGNGSAQMELESFGGTIALRRPGEARPETDRERRHRRHGGG